MGNGQKSGLVRRLLEWYEHNRRDLPWRQTPGSEADADPYAVLVSEFMLQQTQVATVTPYFLRFMAQFPAVANLAAAPLEEILRLWQGLGYYRRARNLHAAAKKIVADFGGRIPDSTTDLMTLPGVGRYTAGAIASIAFGQRAPILDGNVARVLCRLRKICADPTELRIRKQLWQLAEEILPTSSVGQFNSALMDLGATVCTQRNPTCTECPLSRYCQAHDAGLQNSIPPARQSRPTPLVRRSTICISRGNRWLIEKRPDTGRWAGLWQFPTIENDRPATAAALSRKIGLPIENLKGLGQIRHALTHRRYIFDVFTATTRAASRKSNWQWADLKGLDRFPMSRPQLRIAAMILARAFTASPRYLRAVPSPTAGSR